MSILGPEVAMQAVSLPAGGTAAATCMMCALSVTSDVVNYGVDILAILGRPIQMDVTSDVLERLDSSALTAADLDHINAARPIRPSRWYDYIYDHSDTR